MTAKGEGLIRYEPVKCSEDAAGSRNRYSLLTEC